MFMFVVAFFFFGIIRSLAESHSQYEYQFRWFQEFQWFLGSCNSFILYTAEFQRSLKQRTKTAVFSESELCFSSWPDSGYVKVSLQKFVQIWKKILELPPAQKQ